MGEGDSQEAEHGIKGNLKESTGAESEMRAQEGRHRKHYYAEAERLPETRCEATG